MCAEYVEYKYYLLSDLVGRAKRLMKYFQSFLTIHSFDNSKEKILKISVGETQAFWLCFRWPKNRKSMQFTISEYNIEGKQKIKNAEMMRCMSFSTRNRTEFGCRNLLHGQMYLRCLINAWIEAHMSNKF